MIKMKNLTLGYKKEKILNNIDLEKVNQNGRALEYVKEQTEEICLEDRKSVV